MILNEKNKLFFVLVIALCMILLSNAVFAQQLNNEKENKKALLERYSNEFNNLDVQLREMEKQTNQSALNQKDNAPKILTKTNCFGVVNFSVSTVVNFLVDTNNR